MNTTESGEQTEYLFEQVVRLRYLLFLPSRYGADPAEKWPLILFLHGFGECGDDLELAKTHGIPKIVENQPDFPFICVSPQCPAATEAVKDTWQQYHGILKEMLNEIVAQYAVDKNRIYLTGISMGGYGTWSLAMAYPEMFAAIAPICGGGWSEPVYVLRDVPVWAFHGADDPTISLEYGQQIVEALRACGGNVQFTVYPGVGHDSWTQTYDNPELYEWFLQHRQRTDK